MEEEQLAKADEQLAKADEQLTKVTKRTAVSWMKKWRTKWARAKDQDGEGYEEQPLNVYEEQLSRIYQEQLSKAGEEEQLANVKEGTPHGEPIHWNK